jgi:phosphoglycerol transferase
MPAIGIHNHRVETIAVSDISNHPLHAGYEPAFNGIPRSFPGEPVVTALLALAVLLLAKFIVFGGGLDFRPVLTTPVVYSGDAIFYGHIASVLRDGWVNTSFRDGYPFGSELYDFPSSDSGNFLIIKMLMQLVDSPFAANNIFFLISYPVIFVVSTQVLKWMGLRHYWAYAAAAVFTFLPFHQMRFAHLLYTMYFTVPLFFYFAYSAASGEAFGPGRHKSMARWLSECALLTMLASFGVYNAAFAVILITFAGLFHATSQRRFLAALNVLPWIAAIMLGVLLNLLPNLTHWMLFGKSEEVAQRLPADAEIYGLKIIQLLMPIPNHFVSALAEMANTYAQTAPLVNENRSSALGLAGSIGLLLAGVVLIRNFASSGSGQRKSIVTYLLIVLLFFATIGGGGAMFAYAVSPMIRGWARISPFIAFASLTLLFLHLQSLESRLRVSRRVTWAAPLAAALVALVGIADQTGRRCEKCLAANRDAFASDREFIARIEALVPSGSAIYQLPYSAFPEAPARNKMFHYEHFLLTANSTSLRSNYGVMKYYPGDHFYRDLEAQPLVRQIDVLRKLGFAGLWINGRGYADGGAQLISEASRLLGRGPDVRSGNGDIALFIIPATKPVDPTGMSDMEIMELADVSGSAAATGSPMKPGSSFAFSEPVLPDFIKALSGLSGVEQWGRWTDAGISPQAGIAFSAALLDGIKLRLELTPFGPNANQPVTIRLGDHERKVTLRPGVNVVVLEPGNSRTLVTDVFLTPFSPASPSSLGMSGDTRRLGVGLVKIEAYD